VSVCCGKSVDQCFERVIAQDLFVVYVDDHFFLHTTILSPFIRNIAKTYIGQIKHPSRATTMEARVISLFIFAMMNREMKNPNMQYAMDS
jgi:hypothetical protein